MIVLNFVEFDYSSQCDGCSGDLVESEFIRMGCFENFDGAADDGGDVGGKIRCDGDSQVRIGEVSVDGCIRLGDHALDRTKDHVFDVVGGHVRRGRERCVVF